MHVIPTDLRKQQCKVIASDTLERVEVIMQEGTLL